MRLLVVDDLEENRYLLRCLAEREGHIFGEAVNGREALEVLRARPFDLVVADILMPVMDGYQLCREVRADPKLKSLPFVFYTATYTDRKDEEFAMALGANAFLRKPMEPADFLAAIRHLSETAVKGSAERESAPASEEKEILQLYNERLVRKLDKKIIDLEREMVGRRLTEEALRESEERYRALVEQAADAIFIVSRQAQILDVNPAACTILGYSHAELVGRDFASLVPAEELERVPLRAIEIGTGKATLFERGLVRKDGTIVPVEIGAKALLDGRILGIARDITERKLAEEQMLHDAFHDRLTGLPNRALFADRLAHAGDRVRSTGDDPFAVLHIDVDRLKVINESLGHTTGDRVLATVAERIRACLSPGDTLARLTGGEFAVLVEGIADVSDATRLAERILASLAQVITLPEQEVFVSASIGIVTSGDGARPAEEFLRDAHIAGRRAKSKKRGGYETFDAALHERAVERLRVETALRHALERAEFVPYYQPVIDLESDRLVGFEALVRWNHPERGVLPPMSFLPIAEEADFIAAIDRQILLAACRQLRSWIDAEPARAELGISVNFSSRQFAEPDVVDFVRQALQDNHLEPRHLAIEVTEGTLMANVHQTEAILARLRALGVVVYIDDFGTGYSSLSYLHQFPFDMLKIDRSFIAEITSSETPVPIVQTIISLADSMGMRVLAEGVENRVQCDRVRSLHCHHVQGYYFSPPVDAREAETRLLTRQTWRAES